MRNSVNFNTIHFINLQILVFFCFKQIISLFYSSLKNNKLEEIWSDINVNFMKIDIA
jgi:hypothetical protein